jgi:hypothetical protein
MKNEGISPDGFISGQTIHNYLASFAEDRSTVERWLMKAYWGVATGLASQYARFSDSAHTEHLQPWPPADGYVIFFDLRA